jgi:hypothetical protein
MFGRLPAMGAVAFEADASVAAGESAAWADGAIAIAAKATTIGRRRETGTSMAGTRGGERISEPGLTGP